MVQAIKQGWATDHGADQVVALRGWRRRVRDAIPLLTSLCLHVTVILIGLLTARAMQVGKTVAPVEIQSGMAVTDFDDRSLPGELKAASLESDGDPTREAAQDQVPDVSLTGWAKEAGPDRLPKLPGGESPDASADPLIGVSAIGGNMDKATRGRDGGPGGRGGGLAGGPLMPFGLPGGVGGGSPVFPIPRSARTVVYVCDASGSMIQTFGTLKAELAKAVTGLKAVQGFNVIFFQDEKARSLASDGVILATPENQRKAFTFLEDTSAGGTTNPIPAIETAFKSKPQVVFLLTDADFPDNAAVLSAIRRLNAAKQTKVNTIVFTSGDAADDLSQGFVNLMKAIAQENGGTFRVVKENEL